MQEEGTPAANMDGQIDEDIKTQRRNEIMEVQQEIVFEKNESLVVLYVRLFSSNQSQ